MGRGPVVKPLTAGDPRRVGPYRITGRLGTGGMGQVYLASSSGGRQVAVKVIRPELADEPGFRKRFAREASAAQAVSGAFTAAVVGADPHGQTPWLATLYVPGLSLSEAVGQHGTLPEWSVCALGAGLAEALQAIHAAGLVHRDLKPSNVLLASDGPRVIDFGIAWEAGADALTSTDLVVGTPGFMAPEQFTRERVGPAADVFCLGAVLTFAGSGQGPFGSGSSHAMGYRVVHEEPDLEGLPARVRAVVARCLAKDPAARPPVPELLNELAGLVASGRAPEAEAEAGPEADPGPEADEPKSADDRTRTLVLALAKSPWLPAPLADAVGGTGAGAGNDADTTPTPAPATPAPRPRRVGRRTTRMLLIGGLLLGVIVHPVPRIDRSLFDPNGDVSGGSTPTPVAEAPAGTRPECAEESQGVLGSGSSTQDVAMRNWIENYTAACPDSDISYKPVGSGAGVSDFAEGTSDFAGSESALTSDEGAEACTGGAVNLPVLGNPVAVVHNLNGVDNLVLDPPTLAKIYTLKITRWDDAAIRELNPDVALPALPIRTIHRSDASGTNQTLSSYLNATAPADWPLKPGTRWSAPGGQAASGSSRMVDTVMRVNGAIGYAELSYAADVSLPTADIDTGTGEPVKATADNASKGLAAATVVGTGRDLALALDYAPEAEAAYPLVSVTYEIVCDKVELASLKYFLTYISSEVGQDSIASTGYARLPAALADRVRQSVATLT
ncbi:phosphate ABC transporter substrate-binding protein PstS [Streptomyces sp. NBC_01506]|uniref:phosphate ABC transporter substrate-binding protein PstS n=1 Tax=Streptomyces sp. NBC_01506 TaxID=2903887 RepID=UPI00386A38BF